MQRSRPITPVDAVVLKLLFRQLQAKLPRFWECGKTPHSWRTNHHQPHSAEV
jgi:hypothetical protein